MGDQVRIVKVDTDAEPDLSSQLQARIQRRAQGIKRRAFRARQLGR